MTLLHVIAIGTPGVALLHVLASYVGGDVERRDAWYAAIVGTLLVEAVILPLLFVTSQIGG